MTNEQMIIWAKIGDEAGFLDRLIWMAQTQGHVLAWEQMREFAKQQAVASEVGGFPGGLKKREELK